MMKSSLKPCFAALAVLSFVAAACGDDDDATPATTAGQPATTAASATTQASSTSGAESTGSESTAADGGSIPSDSTGGPAQGEGCVAPAEPIPGAGTGVMPAEMTKIRYTAPPALGALPAFVAQKEGIFEKHNLDAELTPSVGGVDQMQSLGRQFDFVFNVIGQWLQFKDSGRDVVLLGGTEALSNEVLSNPVVTKDPDIQTIEDLSGKRVGVTSLAAGSVAATRYVYQQKGLDPSQINFIAVPFENQVDQLKAGQLDAIISAVGFWEALPAEGYRVVAKMPQDALLLAGGELPLGFAYYGATREYADANPEVMMAFQDSMAEACEWIVQNWDKALDHFAEWSTRERSTLDALPQPAYKPVIEITDIEPQIPILEGSEMIKNPADPASMVWRPDS